MTCFSWFIAIAFLIFVLASLLRWYEHVNEAVRLGAWNRLMVLVVFPFSTWMFPSKVSAGRPSAVPIHDPVRGFGLAGGSKQSPVDALTEGPPPGTPAEFLVKPEPKKKPAGAKPAVDPDKLEKLRQKMREQGMLDD